MPTSRTFEYALLALRLSLALFFFVWVLEKFLLPERTAGIADYFYGLEIGAGAAYAIGGVQAAFLLLFTLGALRVVSYGFFLVIHAVSMAASWNQLIHPYEGANHLFHAGLPALAALALLFVCRGHDRILSLDQARAAKAARP